MEVQPLSNRPLRPAEFEATRELEHPLLGIEAVTARTLVWVQPQLLRPAYELWAEERVVGTLRFKGLMHDRGLGATAEGLWTFERVGVEHSEIKVYQHGRTYATLKPDHEGTRLLTTADGRAYIWHGAGDQQWFFLNLIGKPLLTFVPENAPQARLRVEPDAQAPRTAVLSFLALLGKYILLGRGADSGVQTV